MCLYVSWAHSNAARSRNYYFPRGTLTANNDSSLHVSTTGCTELKDKSSAAANALNSVRNAARLRWADCFLNLEPLCPVGVLSMHFPCVCICHGLAAMPHEVETTTSHEEHAANNDPPLHVLCPNRCSSCVCVCHGLTTMPHEIETTISHEEHLPPTTTHHYMFLPLAALS